MDGISPRETRWWVRDFPNFNDRRTKESTTLSQHIICSILGYIYLTLERCNTHNFAWTTDVVNVTETSFEISGNAVEQQIRRNGTFVLILSRGNELSIFCQLFPT